MKCSVTVLRLQPILKHLAQNPAGDLWLLATQGAVILTTDDSKTRWSLSLPATVEEEGSVHVSFTRFKSYIDRISDPLVHLARVNDGNLNIVTDSISAFVPVNNGSMFPAARKIHKEVQLISEWDGPTFAHAVKACMTCVADTDFTFTSGLYVTCQPTQGVIASTDRKQAIYKRFHCHGVPMEFTVDAKQIAMCAGAIDDTISVSVQDNNVRIKSQSAMCDLKPFPENMPDYRDRFITMIAKATIVAELDTKSLLKALGVVHDVGSGRDNFWSYLDIHEDGCRVRCNGDRIDEVNIKVSASCSGQVRIWINTPQLLKTLTHLTKINSLGNEMHLVTNGEKEVIFIPLSDDNKDFLSISPLNGPVHQNA